MKLEWSFEAINDIEDMLDYISQDLASPKAAEDLVEDVIAKAELFAEVPGAGSVLRTTKGIDTGYRYLLAGNWMVFMRSLDDAVVIVRVLYAKSDYMRALFGR